MLADTVCAARAGARARVAPRGGHPRENLALR